MANNDAWRGNGPVKGTVFNKYSIEDIEFLRANCHLTAPEAAAALSVKYGRKINGRDIRELTKTHGVILRKGKGGSNQDPIAPYDTFYVTPEFLRKKYELAPSIEKRYNRETSQEISEKT